MLPLFCCPLNSLRSGEGGPIFLSLPFLDFLASFCCKECPCFFEHFPFFPGILGVQHGEEILLFLGGFPFFSKKQGKASVPAVPVPPSVPGKTGPTVPVSGSGSVPVPPCRLCFSSLRVSVCLLFVICGDLVGRREKTPTPKTRFSIWTLLRTPGRFATRPLPGARPFLVLSKDEIGP